MLKTAEREATVSPAVRDFLRNLNITLKSSRMYGVEHTQTQAQIEQTWKRLQEALGGRNGEALQLAVSEKRLLIDGTLAKSGPTEQSFAQLLDAADIASVTFSSAVKRDALVTLLRTFGDTGKTLEGLGPRLKEILGDESQTGLKINEVRFVPAGSEEASAEGALAAQILAETIGQESSSELRTALRDPVKLLQLIAAADGVSHGGYAGAPGPGAPAGLGGAGQATEEDVTAAVRALASLSQESDPSRLKDPGVARQALASLPRASQDVLRAIVTKFAETPGSKTPTKTLLLAVAERMAVRIAQERYERGDASVDAIAGMLGRLNREIEALRKTAGVYEKKLKEAGYAGEEPGESLEDEFWSTASDDSKRQILLTSGAWRIPAGQVRKHLDKLVEQNDGESLRETILCYAACLTNPDAEARRKTQQGLKQLGEYLPRVSASVLEEVIRNLGQALRKEPLAELREEIATTFVALSLEAASRRRYGALLEALEAIERVAEKDPHLAEGLRGRIGIHNRIPDFLEEAMRTAEMPAQLVDVLRKLPVESVQHIAGRMSRSVRRRERDRLVLLAKELGPRGVEALEEFLEANTPAASMIAIGLLSHLHAEALPGLLRKRLREWSSHYHDAAVRQIAGAGAPSRGRLLTQLLDVIDASVAPLAIDEIGMSEDAPMAAVLLAITAGEIPRFAQPYLQAKAIEALGRLKAQDALPLLLRVAQDPRGPRELVVAAVEAMQKIDPAAAAPAVKGARVSEAELTKLMADRPPESPGVRQRLYKRIKLPRTATGRLSSPDGDFVVHVHQLGLGGGTLSAVASGALANASPGGAHSATAGAAHAAALPAGASGRLKLQFGGTAISAKVILRGPRADHVAFEITDMDLEERYKLRMLLAGIAK